MKKSKFEKFENNQFKSVLSVKGGAAAAGKSSTTVKLTIERGGDKDSAADIENSTTELAFNQD